MLPYALAIAIGASSLVLFLTAFLMPKIHRQDDFVWSGVGLLYALVLWFCASSIRGAVLLGQLAAVILLSFYAWEVYNLRQAIADPEAYNIEDRFSVISFINKFLAGSVKSVSSETSVSQETAALEEKVSDTETDTEVSIVEETIKKETTPETVEDSATSIETTIDESEAETVEITPETVEDSATSIETTIDESEAETVEITPEIVEDSATSIETTIDESEAETVEISPETVEDSATSIEIEKKIDAIFQDEVTTEVATNPSTSDTSDVESSNWSDELTNWDQKTKLQNSSEDTSDPYSDSENKTHTDRE